MNLDELAEKTFPDLPLTKTQRIKIAEKAAEIMNNRARNQLLNDKLSTTPIVVDPVYVAPSVNLYNSFENIAFTPSELKLLCDMAEKSLKANTKD